VRRGKKGEEDPAMDAVIIRSGAGEEEEEGKKGRREEREGRRGY
jgi:hypothetical protein